LAERAEPLAAEVIALQQRERARARLVAAGDLDGPPRAVHLPDRLQQRVEGDRILRVLFGQRHQLHGEFVVAPVRLPDQPRALRGGQRAAGRRRALMLGEQRRVLLRRRLRCWRLRWWRLGRRLLRGNAAKDRREQEDAERGGRERTRGHGPADATAA